MSTTDAVEPSGGCCCGVGPRREADIAWNDASHKRIVEVAVDGLKAYCDGGGTSQHAALVTNFCTPELALEFKAAMLRGLYDADYKVPYAGYHLHDEYFTWHPHFYDPDTGVNYLRTDWTALSDGRRYFNLSVEYARRAFKIGLGKWHLGHMYEKAGYYLGLSLHYLTDLTQPFHAANHNNDGIDMKHSKFEAYAEKCVLDGYFNGFAPLTDGDLAVDGIANAGDVLIEVAREMKSVYVRDVKPIADKKGGHDAWGPEANEALSKSLMRAPRITARYLCYWARAVRDEVPVDPFTWYRIYRTTPAGQEEVRLDGGYYKSGSSAGGRSQFFFHYNEDGTCTLATKDYPRNPWMEYRAAFGKMYISEYKDAPSPPPWQTRFRVVRETSGAYWFFAPSDDEVVGVDNNRDLIRWIPTDPSTQVFLLEPIGRMTQAEIDAIRAAWPKFGLPWWGQEMGGA